MSGTPGTGKRNLSDLCRSLMIKSTIIMKVVAVVFLLLSVVSSLNADAFTFTTISFPGSITDTALGINDSGQIVGTYDLSSPGPGNQAFLLSGGVYTPIPGRPGSNFVFAHGINNSGQIVGEDDPNGVNGDAFLLSGGVYTSIAPSGAVFSFGEGINNNGDIVGSYSTNVTGQSFLLSGGTLTTVPVPLATGINDSGQIVGAANAFSAFLLSGGVFTNIPGPPGSILVDAAGINNEGQIVGAYEVGSYGSPMHGFLLSGGVYTTIDFPGSTETLISGINDNGQMVGWSTNGSTFTGFLVTPTPEPGTLLSTIGALGLLGAWGWKRRL
jgi:uncharacterized membrane protein